ncbi:MYG1 family protein [Coraliomargarita algicola]|uniref:MYG1 family protein n=1 Tax=Coraliomargarita algicola TaxID=3092156 RepID=A0ABZ0RM49_9BACT|nr:MYG1 family protein [Coraliomargarita sp. J2-16]WPJ96173.1 MYG1 family protein [Coraliomargarita sp. J2-16]
MLSKIITHPGGAHKDDFLACAVLLTQAPVTIERRDPTEADLNDPSVAVLDIGHQNNSKLHNFDHHQFPRDHVPTCALSLVLQHLGIYEDAREFCSWLEVAEWFDCRGPVDTAEWLGMDRDTLGKLNSPLDITILRRFASKTEHKPGEPIWEIMRMIGQDTVDYITNLRSRLDFVAEHAEIWEFDGYKALFMPRTDPMPDEASAGLGYHVEKLGLQEEVLALIYPDSRGTGYGMRRFNDDTRMEFTQLDTEDDVHFTHARGFIAKTSSAEIERLQHLVAKAYKPRD